LAAYLSPRARAARWTRRRRRKLLVGGMASALAIAAGGTWWATRPPYHEVQYQEGLRRYHAGDYGGAVQAFSNSLHAEPQSVKALFARGQSYYRQGEYIDAQKDYVAAAKIESRGLFWFCAGCCGLFDNSGPVYLWKALESGYDKAAVYCNLGICAERVQQGAGSGNFQKAITEEPNLQAPYVELAVFYLNAISSGQRAYLPDALAAIDKACAIGPLDCRMLLLAARIHQRNASESPASEKQADRYFRLWIEHGGQLKNLRTDPILGPLANRFAEVTVEVDPALAAQLDRRPGVHPPLEADLSRLP
jgi:Tfp pilus assembly protein PilF